MDPRLEAARPAVLAAGKALRNAPAVRDSCAWLEDKEYAVAVHTRRLADPGQWASPIDQAARKIAGQHALEVIPGKLVWELRPPVRGDKGDAVRRVVAESGARGVVVGGRSRRPARLLRGSPARGPRSQRAAGGSALRGGSASAARRGRPHHRGAGRSPRLLAAACRLKARGPGAGASFSGDGPAWTMPPARATDRPPPPARRPVAARPAPPTPRSARDGRPLVSSGLPCG